MCKQGGSDTVKPVGQEACPDAPVPSVSETTGDASAGEAGTVAQEEVGADRHPDKHGSEGRRRPAAMADANLSSDAAGDGSKERSGSGSLVAKGPDVSERPWSLWASPQVLGAVGERTLVLYVIGGEHSRSKGFAVHEPLALCWRSAVC